ncbi:glycosyl hydrolase family 57 [Caldanaerobacter subterraneus KAk]|uniref:glycosyl hydrolase family 57 n=1 Tax=Caldanaerobacter subterraneus TaxID=911092 RepID=UPI0032C1C38A
MNKVHLGFGFHVNLYHSYRGDTPDEAGFGGDIRVIRKIIEVLNEYNEKGIQVKGTWDIENAFSLEKILPQYAPDIIEGIKKRVKEWEDEVILMSYNNGLLSAMEDGEFEKSITWAISNERGSGLKDVFGTFSPVIRPQEVMFTPSHVKLYKKLGIEAVILYYSAVNFDAFRTFIPLLPEKYAYNPMWYDYKGEKIVIIPAINHGDLFEFGSLRELVKRLHNKQLKGEIDRDVFVFINMDADSEFWYEYKLPSLLKKLPLVNGIEGLIEEVKDLEFVVFDTPYNYLKTHSPEYVLNFYQDTADGSFDGYSSWAEKTINHLAWTRLEKARLMSDTFKTLLLNFDNDLKEEVENTLKEVLEKRVRLLSTTHFGLSAPLLNKIRENKVLEISEDILKDLKKIEAIVTSFIVDKGEIKENIVPVYVIDKGKPYISFNLTLKDGFLKDHGSLAIYDDEGGILESGVIEEERFESGYVKKLRVFVKLPETQKGASYPLKKLFIHFNADYKHEIKEVGLYVNEEKLVGEGFEIRVRNKKIREVFYNGEKFGEDDFIRSYIAYKYKGEIKEYEFNPESIDILKPFGSNLIAGYRIKGSINLPTQIEGGFYTQDIFIVKGIPALMMRFDIKYPYTPENSEIYNEIAVLQRFYDENWIEVAPSQIKPFLEGEIKVVKHNYQNDLMKYSIEDFERADKRNVELDSLNNHITNGFVGVEGNGKGVIISANRFTLSSLAFSPLRVKKKGSYKVVYLNPFGTYWGKQKFHPTYGNGNGYRLTLKTAAHIKSLAPSYNGVREKYVLGIFPYLGEIDEKMYQNIKAFSDSGYVMISDNEYACLDFEDNVNIVKTVLDKDENKTKVKKKLTTQDVPLMLLLKVLMRGLYSKVRY